MRFSYTEKNTMGEDGGQDIRQTRNTGPIYKYSFPDFATPLIEGWSGTDGMYHSTVTVSRIPRRPFQWRRQTILAKLLTLNGSVLDINVTAQLMRLTYKSQPVLSVSLGRD